MKKYHLYFAVFLLCIASCSKKDEGSGGLSQNIKNFVPQSVIDSMRQWGLIINEGNTPPAITGIYNFSPNLCTYDNSGYDYSGAHFSNYRFRFRDQDNSSLTIATDYKAIGVSDTASGVGSFIAGSASNFTVFVNVAGVSDGVSYKAISFYTGVMSTTGVHNFQIGYYLKEKGPDPSGILAKVGTSRIFKDEDEFSDINATYRSIPVNKAVLSH